jgi:hypothetical protein
VLNPSTVLNDVEFKQPAQVFAIIEIDNKAYSVPAIIYNNFRLYFTTDKNMAPQIKALTHRELLTKNFPIYPKSEAAFLETANLNVANMLLCHVNNLFVGEALRESLNGGENTNILGMRQEFIDFLAVLCREIYKSGTPIFMVSDELKQFVGSLINQAGGTEILYDIMPYTAEGVKRFASLYLEIEVSEKTSDEEEFPEYDDESMNFLGNIGDLFDGTFPNRNG